MKHKLITVKCIAVFSGFLSVSAQADSVVFEIGAFDNSQADFEQEADPNNDPRYYTEAGNFTEVQGVSGFGEDAAGAEILQDGPTAMEWVLSTEGFPRALVPGRPVIDIFFQLTAEEAQAPGLRLNTRLIDLGGNSSHDLTVYLNRVPFWRKPFISGSTDLEIQIPKDFPGMVFNAGANVLSVVRTGGGRVDAAGADNPWIQFDALTLTALTAAPPSGLIFQAGRMDMSQAEFEQEGPNNDPAFYFEPGNYSEVQGRAGFGMEAEKAEIWQDGSAPEDWALTTEGFPRALVPGRGVIDVFFQMTAQEAAADFLHFQTDLIQQGGNSSHDVRFYLNDSLVMLVPAVQANTPVDLYIPRAGLLGAGTGAPFRTGGNVLSTVRTGGGPVDPEGPNQPWLQIDFMALSAAGAPPAEISLPKVLLEIGTFNESTAEFEQESGAMNDPQFYAHGGNYTEIEGRAGFGMDHPTAEILQDGVDFAEWSNSLEGFPRALVPGRDVIDIFFQLDETAAQAETLHFSTRAFGLGGNSTHDLEFFINGKSFHARPGITGAVDFSMMLPREGNFVAGGNVLSFVRTAGGPVDPEGPNEPWIQFDAVSLTTTASVSSIPAAPQTDFRVAALGRNAVTGAITLSWESAVNMKYTVQTSASPAAGWTALDDAKDLPGTGQAIQYTDSAVPAGALRRFYRVVRSQ